MTTEARPSSVVAESGEGAVVDYQAHWYPRSVVERLVARSIYPRVERDAHGGYVYWLDEGVSQPLMEKLTADIEEHIAHATDSGVDVLVIASATLSEVFDWPAREAADFLDALHVEYASAQRRYPDRLSCLAALPMQDAIIALEVLERAIGELGLRGVSLLTTIQDGHPLVTEGSLAVFSRIAELGVPLVLHPGFRSATRVGTQSLREESGLSWMYQTALTALRLVDGGVFDAVPDLVVVHPHLGGVLPYLAERISSLGGSRAEHRLEHYFRTNFYVDTAGGHPGALRLAIDTYGSERVVFGSDYPFYRMDAVRRWVETSLEPQAVQQLYANRVGGLRVPPLRRVRTAERADI
jgi:aminocarboxymuconate-semialdehyde decarboxylase